MQWARYTIAAIEFWVSTDDIRLILLYEIQERSLAGSFTRLHFAFDMATNYSRFAE